MNFRCRLREMGGEDERIRFLNECKKEYLMNPNCSYASVQLSLKGLGTEGIVKKVNSAVLKYIINFYS